MDWESLVEVLRSASNADRRLTLEMHGPKLIHMTIGVDPLAPQHPVANHPDLVKELVEACHMALLRIQSDCEWERRKTTEGNFLRRVLAKVEKLSPSPHGNPPPP